MSTYLQRVARNILPCSVAQTLPQAFEEWHFAGNVTDHEDTDHDCELCDQDGLRYHFEIANSKTQCALLIGSSCILKFNIAVFDDHGRRLTATEARTHLDRLIDDMRHAACLKVLAAVAAHERNDILEHALAHLDREGNLTPKLAWVVLWKLKQWGIEHSPEYFKIALRTDRCRRDLKLMEPDRVHALWPALSPSQRKLAVSWGHTAPVRDLGPSKVMVGQAATQGWTYDAMRAAGWTDALLVAHGMML